MEQDDIIIRQGIVHILDGELGCPVFSEQLMELSPDTNDFFRQHIFKIMSGDDMKKCYFNDEEGIEGMYKLVKEFSEENMIQSSKEMAGLLYSIMNSNITIPSADFAAITFQCKVRHFRLLHQSFPKQ